MSRKVKFFKSSWLDTKTFPWMWFLLLKPSLWSPKLRPQSIMSKLFPKYLQCWTMLTSRWSMSVMIGGSRFLWESSWAGTIIWMATHTGITQVSSLKIKLRMLLEGMRAKNRRQKLLTMRFEALLRIQALLKTKSRLKIFKPRSLRQQGGMSLLWARAIPLAIMLGLKILLQAPQRRLLKKMHSLKLFTKTLKRAPRSLPKWFRSKTCMKTSS